MFRADDPQFALRHQVVTHARTLGRQPAARQFGCARNTVRKWRRPHQAPATQGLPRQSRAPKSCPHKTAAALEARVVALRQKSPGFCARRLLAEFDLPVGHDAVHDNLSQDRLAPPAPWSPCSPTQGLTMCPGGRPGIAPALAEAPACGVTCARDAPFDRPPPH